MTEFAHRDAVGGHHVGKTASRVSLAESGQPEVVPSINRGGDRQWLDSQARRVELSNLLVRLLPVL